jgi:hypothetical protein
MSSCSLVLDSSTAHQSALVSTSWPAFSSLQAALGDLGSTNLRGFCSTENKMAGASSTSLQRHLRGGTAFFGPGYGTLRFDFPSNARLTDDVLVETDANTILIDIDPHVNVSPRSLKTILEQLGNPLHAFRKITPAQRLKWNATMIAGFYRPESAQAALNRLDHVSHVQSRLLYTVCFTSPEEIATLVSAEALLIASQAAVDLVWERYPRGKVRLSLLGADKEVVAETKRSLESIFAGRLATVPTATDFNAECTELWHEFFGTADGRAWLQQLSCSTPNCWIVSDDAHQRIRIYTTANMDHVVRQLEQDLVAKIEEFRCLDQSYMFVISQDAFQNFIQSGVTIMAQRNIGPGKFKLEIAKRAMTVHCSQEHAQRIRDALNLEGIQPVV